MKQIQKLTVLTFLLTVYVAFSFAAVKKEYLWPKGKMPDSQQHQIAALKSVASQKDFNADKNRLPYLEWYDAPAKGKRTGACMILIRGGAYEYLASEAAEKQWRERLTEEGIQCVGLIYRTPRQRDCPYTRRRGKTGSAPCAWCEARPRSVAMTPRRLA